MNADFPYPYTEKNATDFINYSAEKFLQKQEMHFGIINAKNKLIGVMGLHEMDYNNKKCDIGIWIGSAYQGFGYSTEAYKLLLGFAFYNLKFNRVYTLVFPPNYI